MKKLYRNFLVFTVLIIPVYCITWAQTDGANDNTGEIKQDSDESFGFTQGKWNLMRKAVEEGRNPGEKVETSTHVPVAIKPVPQPVTQPSGTIELPYETKLSITGRKTIGMDVKFTNYDQPLNNVSNTSSFDMKQELQVQISGNVGKKIKVNVNFDDTVPDKRDISVSYAGDPDEFVQEAAFGDINLALPGTRFVNDSRQGFGVKLVTKYKKLKTWLIGSQAKGTPATRKFHGQSSLSRPDIQDISYFKRKYYNLKFDTSTVIDHSTIEIYRDEKNPLNYINTLNLTYSSYTAPTVGISTAVFRKLSIEDYTVDYNRNMVIFKQALPENSIVCVNYKLSDRNVSLNESLGTTNYIMLKDDQNKLNNEIKTYYSLGNTQIVQNNGLGNFILYIVKDSGAKPTPVEWQAVTGNTDIPTYAGNTGSIKVDFTYGIFNIENPDGTAWNAFPQSVYLGNGTHSEYKFFVEYKFRSQKQFYELNSGVIPQSEQVMLDGKILRRDVEYFIDYDAGLVTFVREGMVTETSVVDISYEYSTLGLQVGETFSGIRNEISLTKNIFVGVSYMKNYPARGQGIPDLNSVASDLSIMDVNSRITDVNFGPLKLGVQAEYAKSNKNMNIFGKAMIDSMESIKQIDGPSISQESWKYGWTLSQYYAGDINRKGAIWWENIDADVRDIYNIVPPAGDPERYKNVTEKERVLHVSYDLTRASEAAIVQNMSSVGLDFFKKDFFEFRVKGTKQDSGKMIVELGQFNEDVDHTGIQATEDLNGNGYLDNINGNEDIGWLFQSPQFSSDSVRVGVLVNNKVENNGILDSKDIDGNNLFETHDNVVGHYEFDLNTLNPDGWQYIRVPIVKDNPNEWLYVKQIRITVKSTGKTGELNFTDIGAASNRWENKSLIPGATIYAINNYDNANYRENSFADNQEYKDLYGDPLANTFRREQALAFAYDFSNSTSSSQKLAARLSFKGQKDFTAHRQLSFFVYGDGNQETISLRASEDESKYFEYKISVNWLGWKKLTIFQTDRNNDSVPEGWIPESTFAECKGVGNPSLSKITYIEIALVSSSTISNSTINALNPSGEIWIDEIYMTNPFSREGAAYWARGDASLNKWGSANYEIEEKDNNFETFSQAIYNQSLSNRRVGLGFDRISFLPITAEKGVRETVTPDVVQSGDLVSTQQGGRVTDTDYKIGANFNYNKLPKMGASYSNLVSSRSDPSQNAFVTDITETWITNFGYTVPRITKRDFFDSFVPTSLNASGNLSVRNRQPWESIRSTSPTSPNTVSIETNQTYNLSLPFSMFKSRFTLTPTYLQGHLYEQKEFLDKPYDKSRNQDVGFSSSLKLLKWLEPSLSYSVNTREDFDFMTQDILSISKFKKVNRSSNGNVSASLSMNKILPKFDTMKSFSMQSSYRITNNDNYDRLASTFSTFDKLWVKDELHEGTKLSLSNSSNFNTTSGWNIFEGVKFSKRFESLKSMRTNATFDETQSYNYNLGTESKNYKILWPNISFSLSGIESILGVGKYISNSTLNVDLSRRRDKNYTVVATTTIPQNENNNNTNRYALNFSILQNYSLSMDYNDAETKNYNFDNFVAKEVSLDKSKSYSLRPRVQIKKTTLAPSYSYTFRESGDPRLLKDDITHTFGISFSADTSFPQGIKLPFFSKSMNLQNRFMFNSSLNWTRKDTNTGDITSGRTDQYDLSGSATYDASANLHVTGGLGISRFMNRHNGDRNYTSFSINTLLSITF